jgi:hypothetical protein
VCAHGEPLFLFPPLSYSVEYLTITRLLYSLWLARIGGWVFQVFVKKKKFLPVCICLISRYSSKVMCPDASLSCNLNSSTN